MTVLFDWDGTLCDSGPASLRAFRKSLAEFGFAFTDDEYKSIYTPKWYRMYEAFGVPREVWEECDRRWLHHYTGETPGLVRGATEVLAQLKASGISAGVVTNGTRPRIMRELEFLGLQNGFEAVICHEDVTRSKPHPEGILKALAQVGCSSASCWYVGDTPVDMEAGHSAEVFTVGVLTQYVAHQRLHESRPHLVLGDIAELPAAIYRLTSTTSSKIPAGS